MVCAQIQARPCHPATRPQSGNSACKKASVRSSPFQEHVLDLGLVQAAALAPLGATDCGCDCSSTTSSYELVDGSTRFSTRVKNPMEPLTSRWDAVVDEKSLPAYFCEALPPRARPSQLIAARARPASTAASPHAAASSVDLPQPTGPTNASSSPPCTRMLSPLSDATVSAAALPAAAAFIAPRHYRLPLSFSCFTDQERFF